MGGDTACGGDENERGSSQSEGSDAKPNVARGSPVRAMGSRAEVPLRANLRKQALVIVGIYTGAAGLWIALSDRYLGASVHNTELLLRISLFKGFFFVAGTAALLYGLLLRTFSTIERAFAARDLAESALRESEQRFRQLAESIEDIFWLRGVDDRMYYVSPAYEVICGTSAEPLYSDPDAWLCVVHPEDRQYVVDSLAHYASGKWEQTYRIVRPDQSIRWVRAHAYPVYDHDGRVYRIAGVVRDITEYRKLDEQLRHAQKMEAVGRLAGGIAHDFNNLLSVILSYTSLLLEEPKTDDATREDIAEVHRAGERAAELTRQLLAFSRQQVMEPKVLELGRVVQNMDKLLRRLLGEDIALSFVAPSTSHPIFADPGQIEQIVLNLAVNARDAMPRGGKLTVEVAAVDVGERERAELDLEPGRYVMLAVTDSGVGMDAATRAHIFEPFFTTKEQGKGTGLGLSTVFGVVQQSRAHVAVMSELGRGTSFRIYFPRTSRAQDEASPASRALGSLRGSETILLVEDDAQLREVNCTVLRRNGYRVLDAQNGGEALLVSGKLDDRIHLLITDVVMPRIGGRELAERLAPIRPDMRVLYVSGYTKDAMVQHGVSDSTIMFLQKPITPDLLLRKVREILNSAVP